MLDSGVTDAKGWLPADKSSLRYQKDGGPRFDNVYVAGDGGPAEILKTGIGAHCQALITAQNLINDLRGAPITVPYRGETGCPFILDSYTSAKRGKAFIASWTYNNPLKAFRPTEYGWFLYRAFYYMYWDTAVKGLG
jgi:sulfide:quinone oxidoreductase